MIEGMRAGEGGYSNTSGMDSRDLARAEYRMQQSQATSHRSDLLERIDAMLKAGPPDDVLQRVVDVLTGTPSSSAVPGVPAAPPAMHEDEHGSAMDVWLAAHSPKRVKPIKNIRGDKIRQHQDLMGGANGKYIHADSLPGATQLGNMRTTTPTASPNGLLSTSTPPMHPYVSPVRAFRLA